MNVKQLKMFETHSTMTHLNKTSALIRQLTPLPTKTTKSVFKIGCVPIVCQNSPTFSNNGYNLDDAIDVECVGVQYVDGSASPSRVHVAPRARRQSQTVRPRGRDSDKRFRVVRGADPGCFGTLCPVAEVVFWRRGARPG